MKNMMAIALGLLLLISTAAANGGPFVNNVATVTVTETMTGLSIGSADFAQASDITAILSGNLLDADQIADINAEGNIVTGTPGDPCHVIQSIGMDLILNGNSLGGRQLADLEAAGNIVTGFPSDPIIPPNPVRLTFVQSADMDMRIIGNFNVIPFDVQSATLVATGNTLTSSGAGQIASLNDTNIGNTNDVLQLASEAMTSNILTRSNALQLIDEDALSVGNLNTISQNEILTSAANTVTGGKILQQADAFTSS